MANFVVYEGETDLPIWYHVFDKLYSHSLLLWHVPPHQAAVERWLERLVGLEVSCCSWVAIRSYHRLRNGYFTTATPP